MLALLLTLCGSATPDTPKSPTAKEALQTVGGVLIGSWRGSGLPEGTREEKQAGLWSETISWVWRFKGDEAWLEATFEKGKYFSKGELRYNTEKATYQLVLMTPDKATHNYAGTLKDKTLTLDRTDKGITEDQRLVFSLLHDNRHLYRYETRATGSTGTFTKKYQVGATKEGVKFADVAKGPECIVSGGLGTMKVSYKGKEYYVCCSGCRDAFKDEPEKYIKEAEAKAKKK